MGNINDTYFDGHYKDVWKAIIPEELTRRETDFLLSYFELNPGEQVLDLMCGYGRHSISLARKGINVTAVDNLSDYILEIEKEAKAQSLPIQAIQSDILDFRSEKNFDLALCMGNSLNFFNYFDTQAILTNIASMLKPGGNLLINTWSLAEIAFRQFTEESKGEVANVTVESTSKYYFLPNRIETETRMTLPDGNPETKTAIDYIFSINEIENLLSQAGFKLKEVYSIPGRKKFTLGDPRAYIVANL